jgi:hypothetical protein
MDSPCSFASEDEQSCSSLDAANAETDGDATVELDATEGRVIPKIDAAAASAAEGIAGERLVVLDIWKFIAVGLTMMELGVVSMRLEREFDAYLIC